MEVLLPEVTISATATAVHKSRCAARPHDSMTAKGKALAGKPQCSSSHKAAMQLKAEQESREQAIKAIDERAAR